MLLSMLVYPIKWFWKGYEKYKSENNVFMVVVLWVISLTGIGVSGYCMYRLFEWLLVYHMDIVIIALAIIWLYSWVKSKLDSNNVSMNTVSVEMQELVDQANRAYPTVRNILYQTLKTSAESIGGVIPRVFEEIEVVERHYTISNNICFFQFRLSKADIRTRYEKNELREFERILQNDISRKIKAGDFPTLGMEQFIDAYGNIYDAIYIDVIEDIDNCFLIQVVMYSPQYAGYLRQKRMNQQSLSTDNSVPDAKWDR
ncbi:MAG: hypothetical protein IKV59_05965 [Lachnospiraceae bacterium]|nr:hypothetical protein [Lachnospiraceae bacterium]